MMRRTPLKPGKGFKRKPKRDRDAEVARRALQEIEADPASLVSGPELERKLSDWVKPRPRARMASLLSLEPPIVIEKDQPFRSEAWLAAVRDIPCVFCGAKAEPAHRNEDKGVGTKTDDCLTAALCRAHHVEIDQGKGFDREERRARLDSAIVLTVREMVRRGRLGLMKKGLA